MILKQNNLLFCVYLFASSMVLLVHSYDCCLVPVTQLEFQRLLILTALYSIKQFMTFFLQFEVQAYFFIKSILKHSHESTLVLIKLVIKLVVSSSRSVFLGNYSVVHSLRQSLTVKCGKGGLLCNTRQLQVKLRFIIICLFVKLVFGIRSVLQGHEITYETNVFHGGIQHPLLHLI